MTRDKGAADVPDLVLERYRLGELPRAEAEALTERLRSDEGLRLRLEALDRSDEEIRHRYPSASLAERVREGIGVERGPKPAPGARAGWVPRWPLPAALAVAAALFVVLVPRLSGPPAIAPGVTPQTGETGDRIKGLKPALALFRKTEKGSEALAEGDMARAGDLIRVGYRAAGRRYGVILSLDGRGVVTLHLPAQAGQAARLQSGEVVLLDHAYELDDAPSWERFFFVTSDSAFDVAPVVEAARGTAAATGGKAPALLSLRPPFEQAAFSLEKETRP